MKGHTKAVPMREMLSGGGLLVLLCIGVTGGCRAPEYRRVEVLYRHLETTGLTDHVLLPDGAIVAVEFSGDSDRFKLAALRGLVRCHSGSWDLIFVKGAG